MLAGMIDSLGTESKHEIAERDRAEHRMALRRFDEQFGQNMIRVRPDGGVEATDVPVPRGEGIAVLGEGIAVRGEGIAVLGADA